MAWQLPDGTDRMVVNAALETLSDNRWNRQAARDVVTAFLGLLPFVHPDREVVKNRRKRGDFVRGLTNFGMLDITEEKDGWDTSEEGVPNAQQEASIGRFILHRELYGYFGVIEWRDFRGNQPLAVGKAPLSRWMLFYSVDSCEPFRFDRNDAIPATLRSTDLLRSLFFRLRHGFQAAVSCWRWRTETLYLEPLD